MHRRVYQEFESICSKFNVNGYVLEIGAVPTEDSLLTMKALANATKKIGINLDGPYKLKDFEILRLNANNMNIFADNSFDLVLSNATLEHDKYFWKTIAEIKRVVKSGGWVILGTPGYHSLRWFKALKAESIFDTTLTMRIHNYPGDYYRFSTQTFKEVFFKDMIDVEIRRIMVPPRIIGYGRKP